MVHSFRESPNYKSWAVNAVCPCYGCYKFISHSTVCCEDFFANDYRSKSWQEYQLHSRRPVFSASFVKVIWIDSRTLYFIQMCHPCSGERFLHMISALSVWLCVSVCLCKPVHIRKCNFSVCLVNICSSLYFLCALTVINYEWYQASLYFWCALTVINYEWYCVYNNNILDE